MLQVVDLFKVVKQVCGDHLASVASAQKVFLWKNHTVEGRLLRVLHRLADRCVAHESIHAAVSAFLGARGLACGVNEVEGLGLVVRGYAERVKRTHAWCFA